MISEANIICRQPTRVMTRLCRHWAHKFEVTFSEEAGVVNFPAGPCNFYVSNELLRVVLSVDESSLERLQQVVADHLQRMAGDEALLIEWHSV